MIHLSVAVYNELINLPKDTKKIIISESVKIITRTALAILGALLMHRLQLGALGICAAILIGAEFSLPTTMLAASFFGGFKLREAIISSLMNNKNFPRSETFAKTYANVVIGLPEALLQSFAHFPDFSIGYLEKYAFEPLSNRVANWCVP